MPRTAPSLRKTLTVATVSVAVLAVSVAVALIALTTALQRTNEDVVGSVESIRLAEEAELDLLLHARMTDGLARRKSEIAIRAKLSESRRFAMTDEEMKALDEAISAVEHYFAAARKTPPDLMEIALVHEQAYGALDAIVLTNVAHSKAMQARGERWNAVATWLGVTLAALVAVTTSALLFWLRSRAFRPIFSLASTIRRFGRGDYEARVVEAGSAELQTIGRQFNEMARALSAQRQAQIAFLGGVAHDLRNPLSALKMSFGFVRNGQPLPPEAQLRRIVEIADRQIIRLDRMIGDLLDTAKIDAGQLTLEPTITDVGDLVKRVVELLEQTPPLHRFEVSLPADPVRARCDALRIEQVLTNLVSNAIKYSPEGSTVEVRVERAAGAVRIGVKDEGIGISEGDRLRLFDPFRRVGLSKDSVPGAGLGLYVVKRLVDAHAGQIEIESEEGRGSTFTVVLPQEEPTGLGALASEASAPKPEARSLKPSPQYR